MTRVGRFDVDPRDDRAARFLVQRAWVPRSRRESVALRALAPFARSWPSLLAGADARTGPAPGLGESLAAVRSVLDGSERTLAAGLSLLPPEQSLSARRLLFVWREDEPSPFAIAKVALPEGAGALDREAEALRAMADLPAGISTRVPRLLCRRDAGGLSVLLVSAMDGEPLLRQHRAPLQPRAWDVRVLSDLGTWLGELHQATASGGTSLLHGDLWSRNVLVGAGGELVGCVDFEASRRGAPWDDVAHFLLESARAEMSARGRRTERERASDAALVEWLVADDSIAREGCVAFISRWKTAFGAAPPLPSDADPHAPLLAFARGLR
jgi:aminoglycoside phosphotransferase